MPAPLSVDLRERVVAAVAASASCHRAAARFRVSVSSASRWADRVRQKGQVAPSHRVATTPRTASRRTPT